MSYYDHAVMVHLKLGHWSDNRYENHRGNRIVKTRKKRLPRRATVSLLALCAGVAVFSIVGLVA